MLHEADSPRTDLIVESRLFVHESNGNFYSSAAVHKKHYEEANPLIEVGKGGTIIQTDFPNHGGIFTSELHLDLHCSEHYGIIKLYSGQITCPMLVLMSTEEQHSRMLDCGKDIATVVGDKNPGF
jgi:hypothetical protein